MSFPSQIDHLGIAVDSIEEAGRFYHDVLGMEAGGIDVVEELKVRIAFFQVGEVSIELIEPTAPDSTIAKFLKEKGPGLHHVAYRVDDLLATLSALKAAGVQLIDESPRDGAHGVKIAFANPKSIGGVLTEFCQHVG